MFGGIGKFLKNAIGSAMKIENRDQFQATVGGCILVIYADGDCELSELDSLKKLLRANETLENFADEVNTEIDRFVKVMEAGVTTGKVKIMKEIRDCIGDEAAAIEVFAAICDIAKLERGDKPQGVILPPELDVVKYIGNELNINLKDFDIEC